MIFRGVTCVTPRKINNYAENEKDEKRKKSTFKRKRVRKLRNATSKTETAISKNDLELSTDGEKREIKPPINGYPTSQQFVMGFGLETKLNELENHFVEPSSDPVCIQPHDAIMVVAPKRTWSSAKMELMQDETNDPEIETVYSDYEYFEYYDPEFQTFYEPSPDDNLSIHNVFTDDEDAFQSEPIIANGKLMKYKFISAKNYGPRKEFNFINCFTGVVVFSDMSNPIPKKLKEAEAYFLGHVEVPNHR